MIFYTAVLEVTWSVRQTPDASHDSQVAPRLTCDFNDSDAQESHDLSDCNRATYPLGGYLVLRSDEAFWIRGQLEPRHELTAGQRSRSP